MFKSKDIKDQYKAKRNKEQPKRTTKTRVPKDIPGLVPMQLKKKGVVINKNINVGGTYQQGFLRVSYKTLVEVFGKPTGDGDGYKVDAEWTITCPDGTVATIYNWKDGPNFWNNMGQPECATPVKKIQEWYVGGHSKKAFDKVKDMLYPHINN
jgi:hypothetical protein